VLTLCALLLLQTSVAGDSHAIRHYVFFGRDREQLKTATTFLATPAIEGAQITYSWAQLEPQKDEYDFSVIREDLAFLTAHGKKLFIQFQDVAFSPARTNLPRYLLDDPAFNGGAARQYGNDETETVVGWVARRWDPAVQQRLHKLFDTLGRAFDGRIEGINLSESSIVIRARGAQPPPGFTFERYRDALIENMAALKRAFPRSVALQYANFMPGEWRPTHDNGYLRSIYDAAKRLNVGVGGPDLLPYRPGQLGSSYPLIRETAGVVPVGIAVQDGNFADVNQATGRRITIDEMIDFATNYLRVDYLFWGTEEPYYSQEVMPYLRTQTPVER
jgi:hypothetical protein